MGVGSKDDQTFLTDCPLQIWGFGVEQKIMTSQKTVARDAPGYNLLSGGSTGGQQRAERTPKSHDHALLQHPEKSLSFSLRNKLQQRRRKERRNKKK